MIPTHFESCRYQSLLYNNRANIQGGGDIRQLQPSSYTNLPPAFKSDHILLPDFENKVTIVHSRLLFVLWKLSDWLDSFLSELVVD